MSRSKGAFDANQTLMLLKESEDLLSLARTSNDESHRRGEGLGDFVKKLGKLIHKKEDQILPHELDMITSLIKDAGDCMIELVAGYDLSRENWISFAKGKATLLSMRLMMHCIGNNIQRLRHDYEGEMEESQRKERKPRQPKDQSSQSNQLVTMSVKRPAESEKIQVEKFIEIAMNTLIKQTSKKKWFPYFLFVLNPNSFVQSAFNVFICSFLLNDNFILFGYDKRTGEPMITAVSSKKRSKDTNQSSRSHDIISLKPKIWIALVKKLNIKKPILPNFCPEKSLIDERDLQKFSHDVTFLNP